MIDLTPLDVRKKRGDFRRSLRGYEPEEVDTFLQLVSERLEELVRENLTLGERAARLQEQVGSLESRERAVHDALVTAEQLRSDVKQQAGREAQSVLREAEAEARRIVEDAERAAGDHRAQLAGLERERRQFLGAFRSMLERQMERLETEENVLQEGEDNAPRESRRATAGRRTWAVGTAGPGSAGDGAGSESRPAPPFEAKAPGGGGAAPPDRGAPPPGPPPPPGSEPPATGEDLSSWLAGFLEEDDPRPR